MMLEFYEACLIAHAEGLREWVASNGEFWVNPKGFVDDKRFLVECNAKAWLVDRRRDAMILDAPLYFIDKETGETTQCYPQMEADAKKIDGMKRVELTRAERSLFAKESLQVR